MAIGDTDTVQPQFIVHIVDDDASVRSSLSRLFRSAGYAARTFDSAEAYLSEASSDDPGCVVLDIMMPGMGGLNLQQSMSEGELDKPIVFISAHADIPSSVRAMKSGAVDFLEKPFDDHDLLNAVDRALARDVEIRKQRATRAESQKGLDRLTPREHEVLTYVIAGMLNKVIAWELNVSEKTVKVHRGRVMQKMGARSVAHLVRMADTAGIKPAKATGA